MGSKGGSTPPPTVQADNGMDPMMMQMMMQMMTQMGSSNQSVPTPTPIAQPTIIQPAQEMNWQEKMQDFRDRSAAQFDGEADDSRRLLDSFMPAEDTEENSLLTETTTTNA